MHTITYVSSAYAPFSQETLLELLHKSRKSNERFGITGMLLYASGNLMQAIEGPEPAIRQLYANIRRDPLHHNVLTLIDEPLTERSFEGWYMGFARLTEEDISGTQGFYDMFREPLHSVELKAKASAARSLLNTFGRHAR